MQGGWSESILFNDTTRLKPGSGNDEATSNSTAVETSKSNPVGCSAPSGNFVATICNEPSVPVSAAKVAASVVSQVQSLEEEPEIPKTYIEFEVTVPEFLRYISFDYSFSNIGDGDYVYIFLDGDIIWKMSGEPFTPGETVSSELIPLRAEPGLKKLIIALYGVGEQNAQFSLDNFKFTTVADTDSDGYGDDDDVFPDDPSEWEDTDGDGIGNNADTDDDGDEISDSIEQTACSDPLNPDSDHDTIPDGIEDADHNGTVDPGETSPCLQDTDSDDTLDNKDNCPIDAGKTEPGVCGCGSADKDHDADGTLSCQDEADDNDGFEDTDDTFPLDPDEDADTDGDGIGDNADLDDGMYPDHAVTASTVDKAELAPEENFTYSATVKNQGTGRARRTTLRYYRSADSTVDSNDTPLGTDAVGTLNAGQTSEEDISLPAPTDPGTYWIGSCVDLIKGDTDPENNCDTAVQITVADNQPDFTVSDLSSPAEIEAGKYFNTTAEFTNQGTLDAFPTTADWYFVDIAEQSTSPSVHQEQIPALTVNQSLSRPAKLRAPCKKGEYFLAACINPGMNGESDNSNNCLLKFLSITETETCTGGDGKASSLPAILHLLRN